MLCITMMENGFLLDQENMSMTCTLLYCITCSFYAVEGGNLYCQLCFVNTASQYMIQYVLWVTV